MSDCFDRGPSGLRPTPVPQSGRLNGLGFSTAALEGGRWGCQAVYHARLRLQRPSLHAWQEPVDSEKATLSSSGSSHCLGRPSADTSVIHVKCPGSHGVGVGAYD